jgi:hypothetical protein
MNFDSSNQEAFMSSTMRFSSPIYDKYMVPAKDLIKTLAIPVKSRNDSIKYLTYSEQASIAKSNRDLYHHQSQAKIIRNSLITASNIVDNSFAGSFATKIPGYKSENQHTYNSYKNTFSRKKFSKIF